MYVNLLLHMSKFSEFKQSVKSKLPNLSRSNKQRIGIGCSILILFTLILIYLLFRPVKIDAQTGNFFPLQAFPGIYRPTIRWQNQEVDFTANCEVSGCNLDPSSYGLEMAKYRVHAEVRNPFNYLLGELDLDVGEDVDREIDISVTAPTTGQTVESTFRLYGITEAGATVSAQGATTTADAEGNYSFDLNYAADQITVTATDLAGNTASVVVSVSLVAPVAEAVAPTPVPVYTPVAPPPPPAPTGPGCDASAVQAYWEGLYPGTTWVSITTSIDPVTQHTNPSLNGACHVRVDNPAPCSFAGWRVSASSAYIASYTTYSAQTNCPGVGF